MLGNTVSLSKTRIRRDSWVILLNQLGDQASIQKNAQTKPKKTLNKTSQKQTKNNLRQKQYKNVEYRKKRACSSFSSLFFLFRICALNIVHLLHMLSGCSESLRSFQPLELLCTRAKIINVLIILFYWQFSR